jgi:hypothetical protein
MFLINRIWRWLSSRHALEMLQADLKKYGVAEVKTWPWYKLGWRYFRLEFFILLFGMIAVIYAFSIVESHNVPI